MKTFDQLAENQKIAAIKHETDRLLRSICEQSVIFNDELNGDDSQARINAAFEKAEAMQTPWFVGGYIMDTCRDEIEGVARIAAEDALYPEPSEYVSRAGVFS